jgi:hypothetical protein
LRLSHPVCHGLVYVPVALLCLAVFVSLKGIIPHRPRIVNLRNPSVLPALLQPKSDLCASDAFFCQFRDVLGADVHPDIGPAQVKCDGSRCATSIKGIKYRSGDGVGGWAFAVGLPAGGSG